MIKALIFDVFGTCVDWRRGVSTVAESVFSHHAITTDPMAFADYWRSRYQPAMQSIRTGNRGYRPLDELHAENLLEALEHFSLSDKFNETQLAAFNRAWEQLPPWPDTLEGLTLIRDQALIGPCSNGSIALMAHLARFAKLPWDAILGADIARNYKPEPVVYQASAAAFWPT